MLLDRPSTLFRILLFASQVFGNQRKIFKAIYHSSLQVPKFHSYHTSRHLKTKSLVPISTKMFTSDKSMTRTTISGIPNSYIVALVLGIVVLVITCVSLCILAFSTKRQYRRLNFCEVEYDVDDYDDETSSFFIGNDSSENTNETNPLHVPKARQQTEWHIGNEKGCYILDI